MTIELYNKMTDDERLQYIDNLENLKIELSNYNGISSNIMEMYKRLLGLNENLTYCENKIRMRNDKYYDYIDELMKKYDLYPSKTNGGYAEVCQLEK